MGIPLQKQKQLAIDTIYKVVSKKIESRKNKDNKTIKDMKMVLIGEYTSKIADEFIREFFYNEHGGEVKIEETTLPQDADRLSEIERKTLSVVTFVKNNCQGFLKHITKQ